MNRLSTFQPLAEASHAARHQCVPIHRELESQQARLRPGRVAEDDPQRGVSLRRWSGLEGWTAQIQANITSTSAGQDTIEGYLFKSADSLDYSRIDELDEAHFPFLKEPIATADGLVLPVDKGIRRQFMKEAKLLTELTSPRTALEAEHRQLMVELANLQDGPEYQAKNARLQEIVQQMLQSDIAQFPCCIPPRVSLDLNPQTARGAHRRSRN